MVSNPEGGAPFPALVQYPTDAIGPDTTIGPYTFKGISDAPPAAGRFPVCVISHGGGGSHMLYRSIGAGLADAGFIVVTPEHPGDNRNDRSRTNTDDAARHRPLQATCAIDAVLTDEVMAPVADDRRLCIVGHSMGGYTALALAGGQPWSRSREPIPVHHDPRINAAVLLAPSTDWFRAPGALAEVTVPLLVLVGELDDVTPPDAIRGALAGLPNTTPLTLEVIPGAGHFAFLTPFPVSMRRADFRPAMDPPGFDREALHEVLPARIATFLLAALTHQTD